MANPSKRKGTAFENEMVDLLRQAFPDIDRAKTNNPSCDLVGAPFPIECKHRKVWSIPEWVRKIRAVAEGEDWMILVAPGDRRRKDAPPTLAVMPASMAARLLEAAGD